MTEKILIIPFLAFFSCSTSTTTDDNTKLTLRHLDQEIQQRILLIDKSPEYKITRCFMTAFSATEIDAEIRRLLAKIEGSQNDVNSIVRIDSLFQSGLIKNCFRFTTDIFLSINSSLSKDQIILNTKLNELTLLDRVITDRNSLLHTTNYQAKVVPTKLNDSIFSADVILLRTDTIMTPEVWINYEGQDSLYLPIIKGKGKYEVSINSKRKIARTGQVDCRTISFPFSFTDSKK